MFLLRRRGKQRRLVLLRLLQVWRWQSVRRPAALRARAVRPLTLGAYGRLRQRGHRGVELRLERGRDRRGYLRALVYVRWPVPANAMLKITVVPAYE